MKKGKEHFPDMKIIKVHNFSKTNVLFLFESRASIKDAFKRLDHKSTMVTTDIYIKITESKQNKTAGQFEKYRVF